jgi:hypothetical protein
MKMKIWNHVGKMKKIMSCTMKFQECLHLHPLTPTPSLCYKDEWINEWINEEQDIINVFLRPPPFPLPLNANPHPLQPTTTAEQSPSPQIYSHFRMPMTNEEVNDKLHDDPFWHNMIEVEQNTCWTIKNMKRRAIAAGFGPATSTHSEEEAAQG